MGRGKGNILGENEMEKKALIILAEGFEEIEAITPIDVLRRAQVKVVMAGLTHKTVQGGQNISLNTEIILEEVKEDFDALILPGGAKGAKNLSESSLVTQWIHRQNDQKKIIAAICASPAFVLGPTGVLKGKKAACYPGCEQGMDSAISFVSKKVVVDGHLITSQGPGTAFEFSLTLLKELLGNNTHQIIGKKMICE